MKKKMTYDEYKKEVVRQAHEIYQGSICIDNVREFYDRGETIKDCVEDAVFTSAFWDGAVFPVENSAVDINI